MRLFTLAVLAAALVLVLMACESSGGAEAPAPDVVQVATDVEQGEDLFSSPETAQPPGPDVIATVDVPVVADVPLVEDVPPAVDIPDPPDQGGEALCDRTGFEPVYEAAGPQSFGLEYVALDSTTYPASRLLVQIYNEFDGPTEPGTYVLDGINYADCGLCLLLEADCTEQGCAKTFYAEKGTVTISSMGGLGSQFAATFEGVVFDEVTINSSWVSTPVPGGETWCADGYDFDTEVVDPNEALCNRPDITCVGETVNDFSLQNCESGEMVSVHSLMGRMKAFWVVATAGWCSYCHEWIPEVIARTDTDAARGLRSVFVLGENAAGNQPTLEYCRSYAAQYDTDASRFYLDHDGEYGYATTFQNIYVYPDAQGAFGLPWNALIRASTKELVYVDGAGQGSLEDMVDGLLGE